MLFDFMEMLDSYPERKVDRFDGLNDTAKWSRSRIVAWLRRLAEQFASPPANWDDVK